MHNGFHRCAFAFYDYKSEALIIFSFYQTTLLSDYKGSLSKVGVNYGLAECRSGIEI